MSQPCIKDEFYSQIEDWWANLWANKLGHTIHKYNRKALANFESFVLERCGDVGEYRLDDYILSALFADWIEELIN